VLMAFRAVIFTPPPHKLNLLVFTIERVGRYPLFLINISKNTLEV